MKSLSKNVIKYVQNFCEKIPNTNYLKKSKKNKWRDTLVHGQINREIYWFMDRKTQYY